MGRPLLLAALIAVTAPSAAVPRESEPVTTTISRMSREVDSLRAEKDYAGSLVAATRQLEFCHDELGPGHALTIAGWDRVGSIYHWYGLYPRAQAVLETGLSLAREFAHDNQVLIARLLQDLGIVAKDESRYEDALALYEASRSALERSTGATEIEHAELDRSLAHVYRRQGRHDEAEDLLRSSLRTLLRHYSEQDLRVAEAQYWLGWYLLRIRKLDEARELIESGIETIRTLAGDASPRLWEPYGFLVDVEFQRGNRAVADSLRQWRNRNLTPFGLHPFGMVTRTGPALSPVLSLDEEPKDEVFMRATGYLSTWAAMLGGRERVSPLGDSLRSVCLRILDLERVLEPWRGTPDAPEEGAYRDALYRLLVAEGDRVSLEGILAESAGGVPSTAEVQAALDRDEAIVGWYLNPNRFKDRVWAVAYVIRRDHPVAWVDLDKGSDGDRIDGSVRELIETLRGDSEFPVRLPRNRAASEAAARAGRDLFLPLESYLDGIEHMIVAGWPLGLEVPVEVLRDHDGTELIERFTVSYIPSAPLLAILRGAPAGRAPGSRPALVVGDPVYSDQPGSARMERVGPGVLGGPLRKTLLEPTQVRTVLSGGSKALGDLPRLPYARWESETVANCFPWAETLMDRSASEEALDEVRTTQGLTGFGVVHFATHALIDEGFAPDRSALALSPVGLHDPAGARALGTPYRDGLLTAREIQLGWRLNGALVTLSACQTASGRGSAKLGEYLGFIQAFLRAGARSIVCSQWKVEDASSALVMERFYQNLTGSHEDPRSRFAAGQPMPGREALREAKLWLRSLTNEAGETPFENPVYWAGFILVGDPE